MLRVAQEQRVGSNHSKSAALDGRKIIHRQNATNGTSIIIPQGVIRIRGRRQAPLLVVPVRNLKVSMALSPDHNRSFVVPKTFRVTSLLLFT